jgi:hypothetical protein
MKKSIIILFSFLLGCLQSNDVVSNKSENLRLLLLNSRPRVISSNEATKRISGVIKDNSGNPIANGIIKVNENFSMFQIRGVLDSETRTDSQGSFSLNLREGKFDLGIYDSNRTFLGVLPVALSGTSLSMNSSNSKFAMENMVVSIPSSSEVANQASSGSNTSTSQTSFISETTSSQISGTSSATSTSDSVVQVTPTIAPSSLTFTSGYPTRSGVVYFIMSVGVPIDKVADKTVPVITGGTPTNCLSQPSLPSGLSLSSSCEITGTPILDQIHTNYTITATNSAGNTTTSICIEIRPQASIIRYAGGILTGTGLEGTNNFKDGAMDTITTVIWPSGLAIDSQENLYFAEYYVGNVIRKMTPSGNTTTVAGLNFLVPLNSGDDLGASASQTKLNDPYGMVFNSNGDLFFADSGNQLIRKFSNNQITNIAGNSSTKVLNSSVNKYYSSPGFSDGSGTTVRFAGPRDITLCPNGNFYIADTDNHRIRKMDSNYNVTTIGNGSTIVMQDGNANTASFYSPAGVTCDANNNVYVADTFNHAIRKISSSDIVSTIGGKNAIAGLDNGNSNQTTFNNPMSIDTDASGNLYIADAKNHVIRKMRPDGYTTTVIGTTQSGKLDGLSHKATVNLAPSYLKVSKTTGAIYLSQSVNKLIRKITINP